MINITNFIKIVWGEEFQKNNRLYQIFVHPDYVNTLVGASSHIGGSFRQLNYTALKEHLGDNISRSPALELGHTTIKTYEGDTFEQSLIPNNFLVKEFIEVVKFNPLICEEVLELEKEDLFVPDTKTLQAMIIPQPQYMNDPKIVQTFMYHRLEESEKQHQSFLIDLKRTLKEDLKLIA